MPPRLHLLLGSVIFALLASCGPNAMSKSDRGANSLAAASINTTRSEIAAGLPAVSEALDLTGTIFFSDLAQCVMAQNVNDAFQKGGTLTLPDGRSLTPRTTEMKSDDGYMLEGERLQTVTTIDTIEFPEGSRWNGLPITRIENELMLPPESDSLHTRRLRLAASAKEIQSTLAGLGVEIPSEPGHRTLNEDSHPPCGGAMWIKTIDGGSALICSSGC